MAIKKLCCGNREMEVKMMRRTTGKTYQFDVFLSLRSKKLARGRRNNILMKSRAGLDRI
jgi:hypothetical protein